MTSLKYFPFPWDVRRRSVTSTTEDHIIESGRCVMIDMFPVFKPVIQNFMRWSRQDTVTKVNCNIVVNVGHSKNKKNCNENVHALTSWWIVELMRLKWQRYEKSVTILADSIRHSELRERLGFKTVSILETVAINKTVI